MKYLFTIILAFMTAPTDAQITLEHIYSEGSGSGIVVYPIDLGNDNFKYVVNNCMTAEFSLYNLDHSPYMLNITSPVLDSCEYALGYISTSLFDCDDSNIEYAALPESPELTMYVYRTDGTMLFSQDSVYAHWCYGCIEASTEVKTIVNTPAGTKMHLWNPWQGKLYVYSVCGVLAESIPLNDMDQSYVRIFPNPSAGILTFAIEVPHAITGISSLLIYNSALQLVDTIELESRQTRFTIDNSNLASGTYLYKLMNHNRAFQTGKFVVTK